MQVVPNRHKMCRHFHWQAWVGSINIYTKEVLFCSESEFLRLYYIAMLVHFLPNESRNRLACDILVLLQHIPSSFVTPSLQTKCTKLQHLCLVYPTFKETLTNSIWNWVKTAVCQFVIPLLPIGPVALHFTSPLKQEALVSTEGTSNFCICNTQVQDRRRKSHGSLNRGQGSTL